MRDKDIMRGPFAVGRGFYDSEGPCFSGLGACVSFLAQSKGAPAPKPAPGYYVTAVNHSTLGPYQSYSEAIDAIPCEYDALEDH